MDGQKGCREDNIVGTSDILWGILNKTTYSNTKTTNKLTTSKKDRLHPKKQKKFQLMPSLSLIFVDIFVI